MNYIKYKYYLIFPDKKFKIIIKNNNIQQLIKEYRNKIKKNKDLYKLKTFILLKFTKTKKKLKSSIKFFTGPIKVQIIFYKSSLRSAIKIDNNDFRNNILFYTKEYLETYKINKKDLKKIAQGAYNDKLETRLLAPKSIDQIKKIKL
mgnify:FL=1|jgi:hypothetical protein